MSFRSVIVLSLLHLLSAQNPPQFSTNASTVTPIEGLSRLSTFPLPLEANPTVNSITLTKDHVPVTDTRFTVNTTSLTIADVTRDDSGVYQITASNVAGSDTFTLTVNVYYSPKFNVPSQNVTRNAAQNESFTYNCTPSDGNPAWYSYAFRKGSVVVTEGVSGSVLTINPVVRGDEGTYTCEASNRADMARVTWNLFVVDVPTMPLNPRVVDLMPFSATLQWDPPSDDGGSSLPLTYNITLTNTSTSLLFPNITSTSHLLTNLQHSTQYSWSVQAMNEYGASPSAVDTFITNDSVPILDSVEVAVLSLFEVEVNISLLTNGGQSVTQYTVEVRGTNYSFPSSEQMQVSLLINQLSVNFTKRERFIVRAFAVNSVGTSDPVSVEVIVPFPPNITAPPTELTSTDISVCCGGVQLNLANPDEPIDVGLILDGTLHPADQVVRNDSFLYIMGLQAGTEYSLRIALTNIFGTEWVNTTVRPLLGRPSTPQVTLTPTAGSLRVQLTTMYPGTRESTLQYSISMSTSPRSRRQTGQQTLPVTDLTTPISGSEEVALDPGTYSVTVTVTNQHGNTTSVPQEVTVPGNTALIVGLVFVVILVLLLVLPVFIIVLVYMKGRNTKGEHKIRMPMSELIHRNGNEDLEMMAADSEDLSSRYADPSDVPHKSPLVVTYNKAEEAVYTEPNRSTKSPTRRSEAEGTQVTGGYSFVLIAPEYENTDTFSHKPSSSVTCKDEEEAVDTQTNPSANDSTDISGDEYMEMKGVHSEDLLTPQYDVPPPLSCKLPSAVSYKNEEEVVGTQPNPSAKDSTDRSGDDGKQMMSARSEDLPVTEDKDAAALPHKPPPAVANPSGVPYADLDFSKHKVNNKKVVKKSEAMDRSVYSEVRPLTEQEEQQLRKQEDEAVEGPYVPISIK